MSLRTISIAVAAICLLAAFVVWQSRDMRLTNGPTKGPSAKQRPEQTDGPSIASEVSQRLQARDWPEAAAASVADYHAPWLTALHANDRNQLEFTVRRLEQLSTIGFADILARRPELAGLFCLVPDPVGLASILDDPNDGQVLTSLFQLHADEADAVALAVALSTHGKLIASLLRRGFLGAEHMFVFPRGTPAADEYDRWLRRYLAEALLRDDDALAAAILFVLDQGPAIRDRFVGNESFRNRWEVTWNKFWRVIQRANSGQPYEELAAYSDLPGLWDFLDLERAEHLLDLHGVGAALVWSQFPKDVRPKIVRLLDLRDDNVMELLWVARSESKLLQFLIQEPPLPPDLWSLLAADLLRCETKSKFSERLQLHAERLAVSQAEFRNRLDKPPPGLWEYVPFYSVYTVLDDWAAGDDPATLDILFAAADLADLAVPVGRVVTTLGKAGAKKLGKDAARKKIAKTVLEGRTKSVSKGYARGISRGKVPADLIGRASLRAHATAFRAGPITRSTVEFDVTAAVQFLFDRFGCGRMTIRRLSGLEARVFMRHDATVILRYRNSDMLKDTGMTVLKEFLQANSPDTGENLDETREGWKRAAGALWLASASDLLPTGTTGR